jgi:hypothetical protein
MCSLAVIFASLIGVAILQLGMLYVDRQHFNHAVFVAARAGAVAHANIETIQQAYIQALVPLFGGAQRLDELIESKLKAKDAVVGSNEAGANPQHAYARIVLENPTRESFSAWNSPLLQYTIGAGSRVIPHSAQAPHAMAKLPGSAQSFQQANLIRLRIIQGYQLTVPWAGWLVNRYLTMQEGHSDTTVTDLLGRGLIPLETTVTLPMQSDAIERLTVPYSGLTACNSLNLQSGCLSLACLPDNILCDPACKPAYSCATPELPKD